MPDPSDLIGVARRLARPDADAPAGDAALRRAVSTAYYALFHKVASAAAARFVGAGHARSVAYALLYRGFEHDEMKRLCKALDVPLMNAKLRSRLGRQVVSQKPRDFGSAFAELQESRHLADYHPTIGFRPETVAAIIDAGTLALTDFDEITPAERTEVLALLLVGSRA